MLKSPEQGCRRADLLLVVQDVSNRFTREAIDKEVLQLLCKYRHVPAVLVLNKMGTKLANANSFYGVDSRSS